MNNSENMLDWGLKIPISTGDTVVLYPQDANCYFILSGDIDGDVTFDISKLNKNLLFSFNVILKDLTTVESLKFTFINNGEEIPISNYENLKSDYIIDLNGIYCFVFDVILEGSLNGTPVYTAAVNLAYNALLA